jgi:hypothetical protein
MKTRIAVTTLLSSMSALALATLGLAEAPANILDDVGKYKAKITFSDTYTEKTVTYKDPGEPAYHDVVPKPQKIAIKVVANIEGFDFSELDEIDMPLELTVGEFLWTGFILDDSVEAQKNGGVFPAGKKKATFIFLGDFEKPNGDIVTKKAGSLTLSWTSTRLTVKVLVTDTEAITLAGLAALGQIGATNFTALYEDLSDLGNKPSGKVSFSGEPIDVNLTFGSATGQRTVFAKGVSKTAYKKYGSEAKGTLEDLYVESVKLTGKTD